MVVWGDGSRSASARLRKSRADGVWSNANARGYKRGAKVRDPFQLRVNAYRVLLTRARDVCVLYVPPLGALDETHAYLRACGARHLVAD
jgi:hypothetical protein